MMSYRLVGNNGVRDSISQNFGLDFMSHMLVAIIYVRAPLSDSRRVCLSVCLSVTVLLNNPYILPMNNGQYTV